MTFQKTIGLLVVLFLFCLNLNVGEAGDVPSVLPKKTSEFPSLNAAMVVKTQTGLDNLGLYFGIIDGIWGPASTAAMRKYQQQHRLPVTGIPDAASLKQLASDNGAGLFAAAGELGKKGIIHVFVALRDNELPGVSQVNPELGNGDEPQNNLYWGAMYGLRTFFERRPDWQLVMSGHPKESAVLQRCVFFHPQSGGFMVADAYRGSEIKKAIQGFFDAAAGIGRETLSFSVDTSVVSIEAGGAASLLVYIGLDGLSDFSLDSYPLGPENNPREVIVLASKSRDSFDTGLRATGARPLLWTTGLVVPEAYTLSSALNGWLRNESTQLVRRRAAGAYSRYQKYTFQEALDLFVTGR